MRGFGNYFHSEALPNAIPNIQNNPLQCPYGLYAEQLSGTAFTVSRVSNQKTWLYRIHPSAQHGPIVEVSEQFPNMVVECHHLTPERFRWKAPTLPDSAGKVDFIHGLITVAGSGSPESRDGLTIFVYAANQSMENSCFYSSDGDILIVPQLGTLVIRTELGVMQCEPGHIAVIQRGIKYSVDISDPFVRGYACEVFNGHFELPDLGPIGANGLASEKDFEIPSAAFINDSKTDFQVYNKFGGQMFRYLTGHSPFDVVGWHGNYCPYTYDLSKFCPVNSVLFDHMDPSIFTVLTCKSTSPGIAILDFVIFPPRWMVQENTFRPPYFHRNCMSEYMGLIRGKYDAKEGDENGFVPGGSSLHSIMAAHGPDKSSYEAAIANDQKPLRMGDESLAFMFETCKFLKLSDWAMSPLTRALNYIDCWYGFKNNFPEVVAQENGVIRMKEEEMVRGKH